MSKPETSGKKKILIVDDEQAILKFLIIKFKLSGYDVMTASNGGEALKHLAEWNPDILLLDILMPGTDGFAVLQSLRDHSLLPVLAFSAKRENEKKAMELGANDFIFKPFDLDDMLERVTKLLGNDQ